MLHDRAFSWGNTTCAKRIASFKSSLAVPRRAEPTTITPPRVVGKIRESSNLGKMLREEESLRRVKQPKEDGENANLFSVMFRA